MIEATATAANMRGAVKETFELAHLSKQAKVGDLIDLGEKKVTSLCFQWPNSLA
ncbi:MULTISPECIES: hypothetical protein [unclassified Mesorhizobium]|uniref:hypothetical protein n=1 Tax=unclassified Mesorhizobium TaxID=325217 RepID=UPI00333A23A3